MKDYLQVKIRYQVELYWCLLLLIGESQYLIKNCRVIKKLNTKKLRSYKWSVYTENLVLKFQSKLSK